MLGIRSEIMQRDQDKVPQMQPRMRQDQLPSCHPDIIEQEQIDVESARSPEQIACPPRLIFQALTETQQLKRGQRCPDLQHRIEIIRLIAGTADRGSKVNRRCCGNGNSRLVLQTLTGLTEMGKRIVLISAQPEKDRLRVRCCHNPRH